MEAAERYRSHERAFAVIADSVLAAEKRVVRLRASILVAAFTGKLAAQDSNDESASILLQRIASDQVLSNGHKSTRVRNPRTTHRTVPA